MTLRLGTISALVLMWGVACCASAASLVGHPYHETLAEIEYNVETHALEVAVRFDPIALEHALSVAARKRITPAREDYESLLEAYIDVRVMARAYGGELAELSWVGVEHDDRDTWVYFELVFEGPADQIVFTNTLLVEINPYQVNTVLYRAGSYKQSVLMSEQEPVLRVPGARLEL